MQRIVWSGLTRTPRNCSLHVRITYLRRAYAVTFVRFAGESEGRRCPRLGCPHPGELFLALRRGLLRAFVTVLFGLCRGRASCLGRVLLRLLALLRLE